MYQVATRASLHNRVALRRHRLAGLGTGVQQGPSTTQMVQQVGAIASTATTAALAATVGAHGFIFGLASAAAIPLIGAAIAGITLGIVAILNSGCGQTCIVTSNWANNAADLLEKNIQAYFALPAPRPVEAKAQALANFDSIWNYLAQQCGNPALATAGQNCILDREAGACKWRQTGQPEFPGQPLPGECWNWFKAYRDPIEADPAVVTTATVGQSSSTSAGSADPGTAATIGGFDLSTLLLIAGAAFMTFGLAGSD